MTTVRPVLLVLILLAFALTTPFDGYTEPNPKAEANQSGKQPLTVEDIFGETSIAGSLPSAIRWLPGSDGISYIETDTTTGEERSLFVITSVPSGEKQVICVIDTLTLPPDLAEEEDAAF